MRNLMISFSQSLPEDGLASGELKNFKHMTACLDVVGTMKGPSKPVSLYGCHGQSGNQVRMMSRASSHPLNSFLLVLDFERIQ